jgi:hypothetical protein
MEDARRVILIQDCGSDLMVDMDAPIGERDIDLLVVTGAGASREFGVNGTRLPLMGEWSDDLVQRLGSRDPAYLAVTGLTSGMAGEDFERQLGAFLRSVEAFDRIRPVLEPIARLPAGSAPAFGVSSDQWQQWHSNAAFHLEQAVGVIHESLYGLFAAPAYDPRAAAKAYGTLLRWLGAGRSTRLVYATTNYDTIAEDALAEVGGLPDAGDLATPRSAAERPLQLTGLLDGMPRYLPILHLHGRVGWLRRQDGGAYSTTVRAYNKDFGVPIVMLPDLEKEYDTDPVISAVWQEFEAAVRRARRVFVLGHSLHDAALVRVLREAVEPSDRLAVTVLASGTDPEQPDDSSDVMELTERIARELPGAAVVPLRFRSSMGDQPRSLSEWLERHA